MRSLAAVLIVGSPLVLGGLWADPAGAQAVGRGALGGPLAVTGTAGAFRGAVAPGTVVGAGRGAVAPGASVGATGGGPPMLFGVGVAVDEGDGPRPALLIIQGTEDVPAGSLVGALAAPAPPGTRLGVLEPGEHPVWLRGSARGFLDDWNYSQGESTLGRSVAVREELVGPDHLDLAVSLEDATTLLRQYHHEAAAAADMEARAREIRTKLEAPALPPVPAPERF